MTVGRIKKGYMVSELIYLSWFYHGLTYNPAAITQADINEYVSHYSAPGEMRAGFEYYRAFPQDAIQNQNYSKTKLTMPVLALGGGYIPTLSYKNEALLLLELI